MSRENALLKEVAEELGDGSNVIDTLFEDSDGQSKPNNQNQIPTKRQEVNDSDFDIPKLKDKATEILNAHKKAKANPTDMNLQIRYNTLMNNNQNTLLDITRIARSNRESATKIGTQEEQELFNTVARLFADVEELS